MHKDAIKSLLPDYVKSIDQVSDGLAIPLRSDLSEYLIEGLAGDQLESLALVLLAVKRYCNGENVNNEKVLRITVSGVAGSRKSTWINTLVSTMRKLFTEDETVSVFAPTGSAAFNAGGQTLHRGFSLPVRSLKSLEIPSDKNKYLLRRFSRTLIIIIDERSMLDATALGIIKHYMRKCAHGGQKRKHPWGGIPIIILVGDDYQLPPIMPGAFQALHANSLKQTATMSTVQFLIRRAGFEEFLEIGKTVVYLVGAKRVNEGQDKFKRILQAVRCENKDAIMPESDIDELLRLDLSHISFSDEQRKMIREEATYVFANKEPRDRLNSLKLKLENMKGNPVARIKSKTINTTAKVYGRQVTRNDHFDLDRQPNQVLICVGARVSLNGFNPDPRHGLFHGSLGVVRDIVYDDGESPTLDVFPSYVLVEFDQYCGNVLIPGMPTFILIVPHTV